MELRVLSYFLTVAREENITKAAALLHVTQPTISRQLMQLEEELGVKLFRRSNHSILLTEQGMLLKRRAQELVSLAEKTKRELSQEEALGGEISIGSGEYQNSSLLAEILAAFHERYPGVCFTMFSGNSDDIKERMERGLLDIGFLLEPVDMGKYAFIRSPYKEEWGVLVPEGSPLSQKGFAAPKDLADKRLLFTRRDLIKKELTNWFGEYADQLRIVASGNLPYNLAAMARQNMGIFLNLKLGCTYEGLRYIPLMPRLESSTALAWKKNQMMPPAVSAFIDFAKKYINCISIDKI
ncbi:LysR family transcriptional regulator [Christensenellaceae bacterium NSJ-63]|uniref:LysR family transcriptional regulator n=1 Tax=Guopingia tenuis TaxID=2763656 RepID=A0A926DJZ0_9FIRM|nr:LysR family transcriptional regulator [Guopingia tenuis]MBC8538649.1 LysR family transcriptional regulator [Guopingia tenuis]